MTFFCSLFYDIYLFRSLKSLSLGGENLKVELVRVEDGEIVQEIVIARIPI